MIRKFAIVDLEVVHPNRRGMVALAHRHEFAYKPRKGYLYVRSRAISSRTNDNFDTFPAEELRKSYATFVGKPVFVNHHNDDHTRMRGVIIDAALHEDKAPDGTDDTWVEVLMEVDAKTFPKLAQAIIDGDIGRTSMGCDVLESKCSVCDNVARTPEDYCSHVRTGKGKRYPRRNPTTGVMEHVLAHEICSGLSFFENSLLVEDPADPTAIVFGLDTRGIQEILAEGKLKMPRNASKIAASPDGTRVPTEVETLRTRECMVCGSEQPWGADGRCPSCGYLPPPKPFQAPDTDVAGRAGDNQGWFDPDLVTAPPFKVGKVAAFKPPINPVARVGSIGKGQRHPQGAPMTTNNQQPSVAAAARQRIAAQSSAQLAAENARLREQVARLAPKKADDDNPAQPVPAPAEQAAPATTDEARSKPDKQNVDVETPGGVLPDTGADTTTTPESVGGTMADSGADEVTDVEAPVSGTTEVDPAADGNTESNAEAETFGDPAFAGDWLNSGANTVPAIGGNAAGGTTASQRAHMAHLVNRTRDRIWASLRLAQLHINAGTMTGDLVDVARQIEGSKMAMGEIQAQAAALHAVARVQPQRQPEVPPPGRPVRRQQTPSLAATTMPSISSIAASQHGRADEALFEP